MNLTCHYEKELIQKLEEINLNSSEKIDLNSVKKAIFLAKTYHAGQFRKTGEPYYTHPLTVALMVSDYLFTTEAIVVSLLHDTLEDTDLTYEEIAAEFSPLIAEKVLDLTRIRQEQKISAADVLMSLWREKKHDLLLIKLLDRLHNMETLYGKSPEKQIKTIKETLQYFLAVGEALEAPQLADLLYKKCYENSIKLGVIATEGLEFDSQQNLFDLPPSENN